MSGSGAQAALAAAPEKVIIDTDIGDDIDDAFAVGLALRSPEVQVLGITTTFGDTETRASAAGQDAGRTGAAGYPGGCRGADSDGKR